MRKVIFFIFCAILVFAQQKPPIYIAFHWHMHQPIYWPYETVWQTQQRGAYSYNVVDIFNQRTGPYTSWPKDAVYKGIDNGLGNFGAQVSLSGSLIENLNNLESGGNGNFSGWKNHWKDIASKKTVKNNPRIDLVAFGYHHPLMGLIDYEDIRKQIQMHREIITSNFNVSYSKGIFPPENAFTPRMIPALVDEGLQWVMVDNIHFDRAAEGYPFNTGGNLYEPNKADIQNPNPNDWVQLNGLWAPTKVSAGWGHKPHYVKYINPNTGQEYKIIAVPTSRYLGNEDGRGGFGALNYEQVMSQLEFANNDPQHPILVVLHHDGDNYGGGSSGYYGSNFDNFVNWLKANPTRFVCTTIQDYLDMFPPDPNDVIWVEDGSWSGADNGDPEFLKWNGDPGPDGYSPDRNSWGIVTAAKNYVITADKIDPNNNNTKLAWKYLTVAQTSCYWYWDGSENGVWDSHPARACNEAVKYAQMVLNNNDQVGPNIYVPQREPYNPGATEWNIGKPKDFTVWTYVYDVSGLSYVKLKYRTRNDDSYKLTSDNFTYSGGANVGNWQEISMTSKTIQSRTNPAPTVKADEYTAVISGITNKLVDYYVEAMDTKGNVTKSAIKHVWVGDGSGGNSNPSGSVTWIPQSPSKDDKITIKIVSSKTGKLHWGVNPVGSTWTTPNQTYWHTGSTLFNNSGPAIESPLTKVGDTLKIELGPFNNSAQIVNSIAFVIHYDDNTWDNNGGNDYKIIISGNSGGSEPPVTFNMDGNLDENAKTAAENGNEKLYYIYSGGKLYLATKSAQSYGKDVFIFVSKTQLSNTVNAPWAKAGNVGSYDYFLANESTNNWSGWFNSSGNVISTLQQKSGSYLEGVIDLVNNLNLTNPEKIYVAVGMYNTNDNGNLELQIPQGNGNGDIETTEFFELNLTQPTSNETSTIIKNYLTISSYPNPFNPATRIKYHIPLNGNVKVEIYNNLGEKISTLADRYHTAGEYTINFDAKDLGTGIYYAVVKMEKQIKTHKLMLIK
ncbi:MAG TPA: T9SS type A sorting domain-containing protein [Ignavibacteriales bacterium]|nr:T9SS type A sorting domain-containing protein [Ignavibacteriales bacterium]